MPVFMTHPEHGATHVNSGEVEAHEKIGWKISTHDEWMAKKRKPAPVESVAAPAAPVEEAPKKRGRPFKA